MKKPPEENSLFGDLSQFDSWRKEWKDMPEFKMKNLKPFQSINVHFESEKDRDEFARIVGQEIRTTTKSIWHPKLQIAHFMDKRYIDEEE